MSDQEEWLKISEILAEVMDLPEEDRTERIINLCGEDSHIRREVESLLEAGRVSKPIAENNRFRLFEALNSEPKELTEKIFGNYKVIREIGRGGMGAVFLAERIDGEFNQRVALKIIGQTIVDAELVRRFKRERQILASLNHPNIARLLDGGVSVEGEPFLVMEYIEGEPLLEYAAKNDLNVEARLDLFLKVCGAVSYAHRSHVIHRDIKPANILVTPDGEPKLLDFGLAKFLDSEIIGEQDQQTKTQMRAFTLAYASPEQIRGASLTLATDVYSICVVLFELLTGSRPYHFDGRTLDEILLTLQDSLPPRPSDVVVTRDASTSDRVVETRIVSPPKLLKGDIDNICLMGLRTEPSRRYQDVAALASDIKAHLKGLPVSARPNTFGYRASKFIRRQKTALLTASSVVLAIAALLLLINIYNTPTNSGVPPFSGPVGANGLKALAVLPMKSLGTPPTDQELRIGLTDSIVTKLASVRQLAVRPTSATIQFLDRNYSAQEVGRQLKVNLILEGSLQKVGENLQINLQLVNVENGMIQWSESFSNETSNVLNGQESIANRVSRIFAINSETQYAEKGSSNLAAQEAFLKGNYVLNTSNRNLTKIVTARDHFEQAIRLDPEFALAYSSLALTYTLAGSLHHLSPRESYPKAEKMARRALEIDPNLAAAFIALGEVEADYNWNWPAAEANFKRALELAPNLPSAHHGYSEFLARQGRFSEATYHSDISQELDPTRINYPAVRALQYFYARRFDDSIEQARKSIERDDTYLAWLYLAVSSDFKGDYKQALEAGLKARQLSGGAVPDTHGLGITYAMSGDRENAEKALLQLSQMSSTMYVDKMFFVNVVVSYDKERAFEYLEKAYQERSYWMTTLKVNPLYDSLRGDPRFEKYMELLNY